MNKEKVIRNQARHALKGNLCVLASGLGLICLILILAESAQYLFLVIFEAVDYESGELVDGGFWTNAVVTSLCTIAASFGMPLLNGALFVAGKTAKGQKASAADLFFYYKSTALFFKSWIIDAALLSAYALLCYAMDIYRYFDFLGLVGGGITDISFPGWFIAMGAFLGSLLIRLFFFLLILYYPLTIYSLDSSGSAARYIFGLLPFTARHLGEATRLVFSFIPWLLLCFFVLPVIYVVPYFAVALENSARWLLELEQNRGFKL